VPERAGGRLCTAHVYAERPGLLPHLRRSRSEEPSLWSGRPTPSRAKVLRQGGLTDQFCGVGVGRAAGCSSADIAALCARPLAAGAWLQRARLPKPHAADVGNRFTGDRSTFKYTGPIEPPNESGVWPAVDRLGFRYNHTASPKVRTESAHQLGVIPSRDDSRTVLCAAAAPPAGRGSGPALPFLDVSGVFPCDPL
jgi:hypothetical protein